MKIGRPKSKASGIRIMGLWRIDSVQSQLSKEPSANRTDRVYRDKFSIMRCSFSL